MSYVKMPKVISNLSMVPEFTSISFPLFFLIDFLLMYQETHSKHSDPENLSCQHYLDTTIPKEIPLKSQKQTFLQGNIKESLSTNHPRSNENPMEGNSSKEREKTAKHSIRASFRTTFLSLWGRPVLIYFGCRQSQY